MKSFFALNFATIFVGVSLVASAGEWTQYRGPNVSGVASEKVVAAKTSAKPLWTTPTTDGFSSLVVADGKAFTVVARSVDGAPIAMCIALDIKTGKELWAAPTGVAIYPKGGDKGTDDNNGGDGPRSTPAVSEGRVYVYSADLVLHCLNAQDGKPVWRKDISKEYSGHNIGWKSAVSPIIDGKLVYVSGGGAGETFLAFDKGDGKLAWKSGDEKITHATPVLATIQGTRQLIQLVQSGLVGLDANTGKELWKFPFQYRTATACSPVVGGDIVFCTAGYGVGGAACQIAKSGSAFTAKELWRVRGDNAVASLWSTPVNKGDYIYGIISYKNFGNGPLKCIDLKTGAVKWEKAGFGSGNVILAGENLVALSDDGHVVVAKASPEGYQELSRTKAVSGKCWSTPALSDGQLFVRSTKEAACLQIN